MPIRFYCSCGKKLRTKDENAGKRVKCPHCGVPIQIPSPQRSREVGPTYEAIYCQFRESCMSAMDKMERYCSAANDASEDEIRHILQSWSKRFHECIPPSQITEKLLSADNKYLLKEIAASTQLLADVCAKDAAASSWADLAGVAHQLRGRLQCLRTLVGNLGCKPHLSGQVAIRIAPKSGKCTAAPRCFKGDLYTLDDAVETILTKQGCRCSCYFSVEPAELPVSISTDYVIDVSVTHWRTIYWGTSNETVEGTAWVTFVDHSTSNNQSQKFIAPWRFKRQYQEWGFPNVDKVAADVATDLVDNIQKRFKALPRWGVEFPVVACVICPKCSHPHLIYGSDPKPKESRCIACGAHAISGFPVSCVVESEELSQKIRFSTVGLVVLVALLIGAWIYNAVAAKSVIEIPLTITILSLIVASVLVPLMAVSRRKRSTILTKQNAMRSRLANPSALEENNSVIEQIGIKVSEREDLLDRLHEACLEAMS